MQVLSPGVEHGHQPDLGAEVLGIGGDDAQRLGRRLEQDGVDHGFVLEGDLGDRRRHGEDDMEVRHRQQIGLAVRQPLGTGQPLALRAMPVAAGIIRDADLAAAVALLNVSAQGCRAAGFDCAHDAALGIAELLARDCEPSCRRACADAAGSSEPSRGLLSGRLGLDTAILSDRSLLSRSSFLLSRSGFVQYAGCGHRLRQRVAIDSPGVAIECRCGAPR